ncbi:MAG: glycosyltransferase family 2 protein [Prevotellaceae bacterium]|jgi:glycosyltransferase involved in cell wall biosynthesis|nr:glycosyltransferase family 2 protein [Prevotellaceae bacterium]
MEANFIDISFVSPCFNEEATLQKFYAEVTRVSSALSASGQASACELIFVDDGSVDATSSMLRDFAQRDDRVRYLVFSRNFGKESALLAGLQKARGRYVVTLDADLQDPPSLIPEMLAAVASGEFDCAGTRRVTRKGEPAIRSFFARRFYRLMAMLTDIEVVDGARDFRLMSRPYVNAVLSLGERIRFSKGIFPWVGFRTKWFEYENIRRVTGETKWSFGKLFLYSLDGIFAFSSKPLAIASILGVLFFLLSLAFVAVIIVRRITWGDPVAGWASTACIILFCSGVQLFTVGIVGQYLAKVYAEVKQRPHYIVREEK